MSVLTEPALFTTCGPSDFEGQPWDVCGRQEKARNIKVLSALTAREFVNTNFYSSFSWLRNVYLKVYVSRSVAKTTLLSLK